MPSVAFARESITDALLAEAMPLLRQHWHEVAAYDDIPLAVDTSSYLASGEAGVARCYTVRSATSGHLRGLSAEFVGNLVGYALFFVRPAPHYAGSLQAAQDVIYLDPALRGGTGAEFIAWCDEQLRADGVQVVHHHQKNAHPALGKVLSRLGYTPVETVWSRRLDTVSEHHVRFTHSERAFRHVEPVSPHGARIPWSAADATNDATRTSDLLDFSTLMQSTVEMAVVSEDE